MYYPIIVKECTPFTCITKSITYPTTITMAPNVSNMTLDQLYQMAEAIQEDDPDFSINEDTLKQDIHKWYTGEDYQEIQIVTETIIQDTDVDEFDEEHCCMCFTEFSWIQEGRDCINPNMACNYCIRVWQDGPPRMSPF